MTIYSIKYINEKNTQKYEQAVLNWLQSDFELKGCPSEHFWWNKETIQEAFDMSSNLRVTVALNEEKEVVAYMVWSVRGAKAEIRIVEVKEAYRRQGIFAQLLADFSERFKDVFVLSASVLPQSQKVFEANGWKPIPLKHVDVSMQYIKLIKPVAEPLKDLTDGYVIATCQEDYYQVEHHPDTYQASIKYFKINVDSDGQLYPPIVTPFDSDDYLAVFYNKKRFGTQKANRLFTYRPACNGILVIYSIAPSNVQINDPSFFTEFQSCSEEPPAKKPCLRFSEDEPVLATSLGVSLSAAISFSSTSAHDTSDHPSSTNFNC